MPLSLQQLIMTMLSGGSAPSAVDVVDSAFSYLPFTVMRTGNTFAPEPGWDIRAHANITVNKTYYLNTVTGNDANSGLTALLPKKTWNAIIALNDYDRIIIQDGSYLIRSESGSPILRSCEIIAEGENEFTSDRGNNIGAWSLTSGRTNTYEATTSSEFIARVFDESRTTAQGNPRPLISKASVAEVEAQAGTFFWENGSPRKLYIHTFDSNNPTGQTNLKYYDSNALSWSRDNLKIYIEGVNFRGGLSLSSSTSAGTTTKAYVKNCTGHKINVRGVSEFIIENPRFFTSDDDVCNIDTLGSSISGLVTNAIEINAEYYDSGTAGNNQASTSHNGCPVVRIGGYYHHVTGQCVAEAGATTKAWMLGTRLDTSSIAQVGAYTEGTSYFDTCTISNVTTALQEAGAGDIRIRNLTSNGVYIGTPTPY